MVAEAVSNEVMSFDDIKKLYPDQWVLLGNPVIENVRVVSGIVLMHGKDKRDFILEGREMVKNYKSFTMRYTGEFPRIRKLISMRPVKKL